MLLIKQVKTQYGQNEPFRYTIVTTVFCENELKITFFKHPVVQLFTSPAYTLFF